LLSFKKLLIFALDHLHNGLYFVSYEFMNKNLLICLGIVIFLLISTCGKEEPKAPQSPLDVPDQVMEKTTITFTEEGVKLAVIQSEYVAVYEKQDLKKAKGVRVDFYDQKGNHTSVLVADSGLIQEKKQNLEAIGNVVVTTGEGIKLQTASLRWDPQKRKIVTDDFVKITKKKDVVTGYGLEADEELKHFVIKKRVKGKITEIPEEKSMDSL
jgi:LPS export ABC transporter protein LptC